jgi:hypothetical protein
MDVWLVPGLRKVNIIEVYLSLETLSSLNYNDFIQFTMSREIYLAWTYRKRLRDEKIILA